jgi:NAD(P)-dependent dehydrogenase (short-subunit alcohol dehydrogenase family)
MTDLDTVLSDVRRGMIPAHIYHDDEMFTVNVKSHPHAVKAALPALRRGARGSVILTESISAYYPGRGGVLYVSSKFAVRGLVAALAPRTRAGDPCQRGRARRHALHPDGGIAVRAETVVSLQGRDIDLLKNGMTLCHSSSNLQESKRSNRPP